MAHHHKLDCLVKRLDFSVVVKVNVKGKVQNSSESLSGRYLLSCWTFCNQTWYGDATSWMRLSSRRLVCFLRFRVTVKDHIIKMSLSNRSSELLILLQLNLVLMAHHHKLDCLVKRLDCSVVVKIKVKKKKKVQSSSECSPGQYPLLNCWIFCHQTW